jgi:hypothetical protein
MIASTKRTTRRQKEKIRVVIFSPNEIASRAAMRCNIERNDFDVRLPALREPRKRTQNLGGSIAPLSL